MLTDGEKSLKMICFILGAIRQRVWRFDDKMTQKESEENKNDIDELILKAYESGQNMECGLIRRRDFMVGHELEGEYQRIKLKEGR